MLATRIAATGTSAIGWPPAASRARSTARSLRQNSRSTRASAIGLTFQVSPLEVGHVLDLAVVRRVEAVVHAEVRRSVT